MAANPVSLAFKLIALAALACACAAAALAGDRLGPELGAALQPHGLVILGAFALSAAAIARAKPASLWLVGAATLAVLVALLNLARLSDRLGQALGDPNASPAHAASPPIA